MKEEAQKSPAKNIVEFREICKYFPGVRALDRISSVRKAGRSTRSSERTAPENPRS